jgi:hypothetical protein
VVETWRSSCRGDLCGHEIEVDLAEVDRVLNGDFCDGTNTNPPPPSRGRTCGLRLQNAPGNRLVHKSPGSTMGESADMIRALSIHFSITLGGKHALQWRKNILPIGILFNNGRAA